MAKFKKEVLEKIKTDHDLFCKVGKHLGVKPTSLYETLKRNGNGLNQYSTVELVANHLGLEANELMENEPVVEGQN